ncbi:MAG: hypothetical protein V4653_18465 [Pseudomonadota bacterium]
MPYWMFITPLFFLAACATQPIASSSATPVAPTLHAEANSTTGRVTVTRDTGLLGSGVSIRVLVNGETSARLNAGETVTFHLPQGEAILGAETSFMSIRNLTEREAQVVPGQEIRFRISLDPGSGVIGLQRTMDR